MKEVWATLRVPRDTHGLAVRLAELEGCGVGEFVDRCVRHYYKSGANRANGRPQEASNALDARPKSSTRKGVH